MADAEGEGVKVFRYTVMRVAVEDGWFLRLKITFGISGSDENGSWRPIYVCMRITDVGLRQQIAHLRYADGIIRFMTDRSSYVVEISCFGGFAYVYAISSFDSFSRHAVSVQDRREE